MIEIQVEVAVFGSGFGGSLTALILNRIGRTVVVVDRQQHPRFAIGESSTPIADLVLADLAKRYDLPALLPLTQYGTWKRTYPGIGCGLKRGFSYFSHIIGQPFPSGGGYANQLMVAASSDDDRSDTQWYRADVDAFFAQQVQRANLPLFENTDVESISRDGMWQIRARQQDEEVRIAARFLIDASGADQLLARKLNLPSETDSLRTNSRACFGHFSGVRRWTDVMIAAGAPTAEHAFDADAAALHHLLADGWMWMLRFDSGVTSVGLVRDSRRRADREWSGPAAEWSQVLADYPSIAQQLRDAELLAPEGGLRTTARLQRLTKQAAGDGWAMLPNTYGFIDPLHSTGIAHTICGIEALARILEESFGQSDFSDRLHDYTAALRRQFEFVDLLVDGCYAALDDFQLFTAWSMLYFTGAISYEHQRGGGNAAEFLCANDREFVSVARDLRTGLDHCGRSRASAVDFATEVRNAIRPWNIVGLCDPRARNMYRYTAAPRQPVRP